MNQRILFIISILFITLLPSCNKSEEITGGESGKIEVTFESGTRVFEVKVGRNISVTPAVSGAVNPQYSWTDDDGRTVSSGLSLDFSSDKTGAYYFTFTVRADNGTVREDIRIDVLEKLIPAVSLPATLTGYKGREITVVPGVENCDGAEFLWTVGDVKAGNDSVLKYTPDATGSYRIRLAVKNEDGEAEASMSLEVLAAPAMSVSFGRSEISVFADRTLCLAPYLENVPDGAACQWNVDGETVPDADSPVYYFTPRSAGESTVTVTVTDSGNGSCEASVRVISLPDTEESRYRKASSSSSMSGVTVYDLMPGVGQFVDEIPSATLDGACREAERKLNTEDNSYVSLGAFGGYIVVGFDHSVRNTGKNYDFAIAGNSFKSSNEPGIVWVMQDENGNGLPDDTWYELRGSETDAPETDHNYSVTYYRPASKKGTAVWTDNRGNTGTIDLDAFYPAWQKADSYTLSGTRLKDRTTYDGILSNNPFPWGYVDNFGSDCLSTDSNSEGGPNFNGFRIDNAMNPDGTPARLKYIDFIKVQTGVFKQVGILGEISTEVFGFRDSSM